jgi:hypothetical protein
LGGIWTEGDLVHEMQLMVMHSNVIVCGGGLRQLCRNQKRIRTPICAGAISGKLISSCPMPSNVVVCWRGLLSAIACGQAFEWHHVPSDRRQRDCHMPVLAIWAGSRPTGACSGRALRGEIVAILESEFVPTALSLSTARR